jgi:hypothetical protein
MKIEQYIITDSLLQGNLGAPATLILLFGATKRIKEKGLINMIRSAYTKKWKGYATSWNRRYLTGFYSYGEISPFSKGGTCELHNQTMTITTLSEE